MVCLVMFHLSLSEIEPDFSLWHYNQYGVSLTRLNVLWEDKLWHCSWHWSGGVGQNEVSIQESATKAQNIYTDLSLLLSALNLCVLRGPLKQIMSSTKQILVFMNWNSQIIAIKGLVKPQVSTCKDRMRNKLYLNVENKNLNNQYILNTWIYVDWILNISFICFLYLIM